MSDMFSDDFPLEVQIEAIKRELRYREHVYPRLIEKKRMTPAKAEQQKNVMLAVLKSLRRLASIEALQKGGSAYVHATGSRGEPDESDNGDTGGEK